MTYTQDHPLDCGWIELDRPENWQGRNKSPEQKAELVRRGTALTLGMNMTLAQKVDYSLRVIDRAQTKSNVPWAVSFSAGRDSTVLSYLVVEVMGLKWPHVMSNTRMEYPETMRQVGVWRPWLEARGVELGIAFPDKRPGEVWKEGFPLFGKEVASKFRQFYDTGNEAHLHQLPAELHDVARRLRDHQVRAVETCCDRLKKQPLHKWDKVHGIGGHLTGVRCEESQARRLMYVQRGALYYAVKHRQWLAHPLAHWRRADIDTFLAERGIRVEIPGGTGRSGCVTCAFGAHIDQAAGRPNTLQLLAKDNPRMLKRALDDWGYRRALDVAGVRYDDPAVRVVWRAGEDSGPVPVWAYDERGRVIVALRGASGIEWRDADDLPWLDLPQ